MSQFAQFLNERLKVNDALHEDDEQSAPWWEAGSTMEIRKTTYYERLDMLPPRYLHGTLFVYGEGAGSFSIFWQQGEKYYVHHLSQEDTEIFCQLARVALHV